MSALHPIIGVTGSSGAGTSAAMAVFLRLFARMGLKPAIIEGDAFHAYDREGNKKAIERAQIRGENFSFFGPAGNHLDRLEALLREYSTKGTGTHRQYLHTDAEAKAAGLLPGTFTPWRRLDPGTDILFYEGLHGAYVGEDADIARHMDLLIGVTPVINLEWIQKIKRDTDERGHTPADVTRTILRRMPDYVTHIIPQFSRTDVNFQRVPLVDTSNPFEVRDIPAAEKSLVVVHFNPASRLHPDLDAYCAAIYGASPSDDHTLVVPGTEMERTMELIMAPAIELLMARRDQQVLAEQSAMPTTNL
jgi:phosphoribulokinase